VSQNPPPHPADTWQQALSHLQGQMTGAAFDESLRGSRLLDAAGDVWTIAVLSPYAPDWIAHRLDPVIRRTVARLAGRDVTLRYVVAADPPAPSPLAPPCPPSPELERLLAFDPNTSEGGGFWRMGNYATWFWAALLGAAAWRVYELVVAGDRRRDKSPWTPPRRYSISDLARAVAAGRDGRPNRDQIRGRYRLVAGRRLWQPGAFDRLAREGVARVEWHDGGLAWQPWLPGGEERQGRSGLRIVYRLSVVTLLPLLTPCQVARLPAEHQVAHERYLAGRGYDLLAWEQIALPSLAGLDKSVITDAMAQSLPPTRRSRP